MRPLQVWTNRKAQCPFTPTVLHLHLILYLGLFGPISPSCDFEQLADCRWYFANSRELERIIKVQRLSPLAQPPPVIHFQEQRALSRQQNTRDFDLESAAGAGEFGSHNNNFYVVVSGEGNVSNHYAYYVAKRRSDDVAMIVSPFYERTATKCELQFRHRVLGERGSELLVTTEHMTLYAPSNHHQSHPPPDQAQHTETEDDDWTRPTLRAHFSPVEDSESSLTSAQRGNKEPWTMSRVPLGTVSYPTRVRIECHASGDDFSNHNNKDDGGGESGGSDLNVECHVDDIRLVDCDEAPYSDVADDCRGEDRFECRSVAGAHRRQLCLRYDELCDMHEQCADGEDELDDVHHCSLIPAGARCNFDHDLSSPVGCYGWRLFSGSSNSSMRELNSTTETQQHLIALMTKDTVAMGGTAQMLPPREYSYGGRTYRPGGYLFFSTYAHIGASEHEIVYTYALSPKFPPPLHEGNSKRCFLRFFYCRTGSSPFQIFQVDNPSPQQQRQEVSRPLWSSADDDESTSMPRGECEWRRASVQLWSTSSGNAQGYRLKLSFAKIAGSLGSIAIDDLSLTPSCFEGALSPSNLLSPLVLNLTSCGSVGPDPPPSDVDANCSGTREWTVPNSGFYQIYLFGASGGQLPGQRLHNGGGMVAANLRLEADHVLQFMIGQRGESPCDAAVAGSRRPFASRVQAIRESLCAVESDDSDAEPLLQEEVSNLLGTGGGGATALIINGRLAMVAGGGGGAFLDGLYLTESPKGLDDPSSPEGGHVFEDLSAMPSSLHTDDSQSRPNEIDISPSGWVWNAGDGASLGVSVAADSPRNHATAIQIDEEECHDCAMMNGRVENITHVSAGTCPSARLWSVAGGWGGGGASCGPRGGGGAGHRGGAGGNKAAYGAGGSSALLVPSPSVLAHPGYNRNASGYAIVLSCAQASCPLNSTCEFDDPAIPSSSTHPPPSMHCLCVLTGERIPLGISAVCSNQDIPALLRWALRHRVLFAASAIGLSLLALVFLLLVVRKWWSNLGRRHRRSIAKLLRISETPSSAMADAVTQGIPMGDKIAGNPIYESVQLAPLPTGLNSASSLPTIPRHFIQLERIIGHGAFGEVYSGHYTPPGEGAVTEEMEANLRFRVAVKSLPECSASDALEDFEREARLLSQFKHANIVTFFGVCFDKQPRYIVLEYLEGGDLKNFLRECRPKPTSSDDGAVAVTGGGSSPSMGMLDLVQVALDVARGCEHLEVSKFVHRDIAARNCLLTSRDRGRLVKIADFGMARDIYRNDYYRKGGRAFLPVRWMPPEAFLDGIFTTKTDVWSYGVLLWEIFSLGYVPYSGRENHEVMKLVVAGDRLDPPVGVLTEVYDVMLACWNTESLKRPRFYDLVEFFLQLSKREDLMAEPLPPIRHRLALSSGGAGEGRSSTPSTQDSCQLGETLDFDASIATTPNNNNPSQTTVSTLLGSTTSTAATATTSGSHSSSAATYDSMPTTGSGVCRAVFPPYEPRIADPLMKMGPTPMILHRDSSFTAGSGCSSSSSGSNRGGSQDEDSTPHASAASSIKYRINPRSAIMAQQSVAPPLPIRPPKPPALALPDDAVALTRGDQQERASLPPRPTHHSQSNSTNSPVMSVFETPTFYHPLMKAGDSAERSLPPIDGSSTSTVDGVVGQQQPPRRGQRRCQSSQIV